MTRRTCKPLLALWSVVLGTALVSGCQTFARKGPWGYPVAPKGDVVDDYHGTPVADPYRWLEDPDADDTVAWVEIQNRITRRFVQTPDRPKILRRLTELYDFPRYSMPYTEGGRTFYSKNDGLQNQPVLYVQDSAGSEPRVVLDPNTWSADGTVALASWEPSRDGRKLAYARSAGGSDQQEIRVRDVDAGQDLPEALRWCKFSSIAWHPDNSGFFYNRYPDPKTVAEQDRNSFNRVYWHALGTPQGADQLVYERPDAKLLSFYPYVTEDGRYLVLLVHKGTDPKNRVYYRPLDSSGDFVRLLDSADASYSLIENIGTTFYFLTDLDAPRKRIVAIDIDKPGRESWREVVAHSDDSGDVIDFVTMVNNRFVLGRMRDVQHVLQIVDLNGELVEQVPLPGIGSVFGVSGKREDFCFYFLYTSYLTPPTIFRYDFETGSTTMFRKPELKFDPDAFVTRQVFFESADGTRVPMFITHRKGIERHGHNPTLLYGYGGFNISLTPYFSFARLMWVEQGGIYAVANLRGGGEYGEQWHQAGVLDRKQNAFDDFIAAAEYLIARGYTSTKKLAVMGGSNGGLLTAACMLQRPDLFGAVVSAVPVIDMLRYHTFTVGKFWVSDYGNAEETKEHFRFLYAYSPLHNVKHGVAHPPTLITTADTDDRVVPAHGKKFAATLQEKDAGKNPILLRVETRAGHGRGKPTSKKLEEKADIYAFLFKVLEMEFGAGE